MPDSSGAVDLGNLSQEEREALAELERDGAPETPEGGEVRDVLTAFIVLVNANGSVEVMAFDDPGLNVQHPPNGDLISAASHKIIRDLEVQEQAHANAQTMMVAMQQQMQAAQQAAQAAQIEAQLRGERRG